MSFFQQIKYRFSYFLNAVNEHSLHSPFIYEFYTEVVRSKKLNTDFSEIERLREVLIKDKSTVKESETSSKTNKSASKAVKSIASEQLTSAKYSTLLYRIVKYFNVQQIVELGTCLGINTLYLAKYKASQVLTFEENPSIAKIAQANFDQQQAHNIKIIEGSMSRKLSYFLNGSIKPDLVYIDASHKFETVMKCFNMVINNKHDETIVIINNIKWPKPMQKAWETIVNHQEVTMSIDLNKWGIVFFKLNFIKKHYILMF